MSNELRNLIVFLIFLALLPTIIILYVLYEAFSFPILATAGWLYILDILIALCLLYVFYVVFHIVLRLTNYLGQYHRVTGLDQIKYRLKIIICYGALTVPVYLAVLSLIQLSSTPKLMDYVVLFPVVLSFLISLRILANPTIVFFKLYYRKSPFDPLPISPKEKNTIRYIKEQVTSFFFALIVGGIFIIIIGLFFEDSKTKILSNLNGLTSSIQNLCIFILSYIISLFLLGLFSEWVLEYTQVISAEEDEENKVKGSEI